MKKQHTYKKSPFFILTLLLLFYKAIKFVLLLFLHVFSSDLKEKKYQPTQEEQMMGENIPFSDQYYIPDDKH